MEWEFSDKWSNNHTICHQCGMLENECICQYQISLYPDVEIWLLVAEREYKRSSNTGRLIKKAIPSTKVFTWHRTEEPKELVEALKDPDVDYYLVMAADREDEKARVRDYKKTNRKTVFLLLDGTWKEVRKMIRKSDYLKPIPIVSFNLDKVSAYFLRRNKDANHLCTVEAGIALLEMSGNLPQASALEKYYHVFLEHFERSLKG